EALAVGARLVVRVRRWGVSRQVASAITELEAPRRIVEEQTDGPFRAWRHAQELRPTATGTLLRDVIDYEPPGGMLGLLMTAGAIEADLERAFAWRTERLRERLGS